MAFCNDMRKNEKAHGNPKEGHHRLMAEACLAYSGNNVTKVSLGSRKAEGTKEEAFKSCEDVFPFTPDSWEANGDYEYTWFILWDFPSGKQCWSNQPHALPLRPPCHVSFPTSRFPFRAHWVQSRLSPCAWATTDTTSLKKTGCPFSSSPQVNRVSSAPHSAVLEFWLAWSFTGLF